MQTLLNIDGSETGGRLAVGFLFCARPGAFVGIRHGVLPRLHICARSGALVGIRHGVLPRLHICARSGALVGIRHGVLPRLHICARSEAHSITLYTL